MAGQFIKIVGTAFLAAAIPFGTTGCKNKENVKEEQKAEIQKIKHFSEIFPFKRDEKTGKIFIGEAEKEEVKLNEARHKLNLLWQEITMLQSGIKEFNKKAERLEQKEIKIGDLTPPETPGETRFDLNDIHSLEKFHIFTPFYWDSVYPFGKIIKNDNDFASYIYRPGVKIGNRNSRSYAITAHATYNQNLPLSISIPKAYFVPESISRRYFLDTSHWYNQDSSKDKALEVKEGIYFIARGEKGTIEVIVPLSSLPLTIATEEKMYLIGLDKIDVQKGNLEVNIH